MSTHSSAGLRKGTSLVTCLHSRWGSRLQVSSGTSWTTVCFSSKHSSSPLTASSSGPQSSRTMGLHSVSGVYLVTRSFLAEHSLLGHLVHFCSVVYPWVTSSHFSSWTSWQSTTSSSTSCSWSLVVQTLCVTFWQSPC